MDQIFRPFERLNFSDKICFLSGEQLLEKHKITVFGQWLLDEFNLRDKPFKLLDESIITYQDIKVPCSQNSFEAIKKLENTIEKAFKEGYDAVKQLDELLLFQWMAKIVYGLIYHETITGIRQQAAIGERFNFSQSLVHKFSNFHLMLQSLARPVEFEGQLPWSISVFPVNNAGQTFSYRDEINTLTFSIRMNDFGIIANLQDNGANKKFHQQILKESAGKTLHPIQFEELCARFYYSAYLFNRLPDYTILPTADTIFIESMPLQSISSKPVFDTWQVKTYGQVLENFWKPWGYSLFEIIKDPEAPMSFITSHEATFNDCKNLALA
ncbi:hypothetical protein GS399_02845 [Pedobacter sp. HMF7647]|uniref:Uncharacterized protein n=1 Tax=Hufsiella arboris TaxID=2695275 RepID=A0A7K1Y5N2_9SPHI|nr:hypothetical protein [Hufsiella arboris]MXV49894.1 hypothetical protein [Hufsiella arboris]